jgi:transposase
MNHYEKTQRLKDSDFKQIIGVKRETFSAMAEVLATEHSQKHAKGGRPPKLTLEEQLLMTLKYLRQYVTQKELAYEFEVGEATVHDTIVWVENTLVKSDKFKLPGKKELLEDESIEVILVDVTECPIERPKKTAAMVFGEKEKAHHKNPGCGQQTHRRNHLRGGRLRENA